MSEPTESEWQEVRAQLKRLGFADIESASHREMLLRMLQEIRILRDELEGKPSAQAAAKLLAQYSNFSEEQLMTEKVKNGAYREAIEHSQVAERGLEEDVEEALRTLNWWHAWH